MINIKTFVTKAMSTNCYVLSDTENQINAIIDPGERLPELEEYLENTPGTVEYILLTHGHFDHITFADYYRNKYNSKIVIYIDESKFTENNTINLSKFFGISIEAFKADILVSDGDELPFGSNKIKVMHTPGHTQGSCSYITNNMIFSGDTLFAGSFGRTDFPTGDYSMLMNSLDKLLSLDDDLTVYPGHGESTTIKREKLQRR